LPAAGWSHVIAPVVEPGLRSAFADEDRPRESISCHVSAKRLAERLGKHRHAGEDEFAGSFTDRRLRAGVSRNSAFFSRAPFANAAKVAANWLLSREGQSAWLDANHKSGGLYDSLREDIPK
jgi:hypothetical protein